MDISKRGMAGLIESDLLPGDPVTIQLELPTSGERLLLPAQVLHRNGSRYGFKFIALSMRQIESLQQLCQTLEKVKIQPSSAPGTPHKCARALLLEKAIEDRTQHLEVLRSVLKHTNGSSQEYWQSEIDKLETEIRVTAELLQQQYEMDEGSSKGGKNPV